MPPRPPSPPARNPLRRLFPRFGAALACCLLVFPGMQSAPADTAAPPSSEGKKGKTVRLLTVGNSESEGFNFAHAAAPALPDQSRSLHVGWRWRRSGEGPPRLGMDGRHAGPEGEYLAACVWFEVLFGETVIGNPFAPPALSPERARWLQEIAHRAVAETSP